MNCYLELESISFSYKTAKSFFGKSRKNVLQNISLQIYAGETFGVLGRNGSGKSTLLRLLAGTLFPTTGTIKRYCKKVNLLSIELGFSEQLTGIENIILSGMFNGFSKKDMLEKLDTIIEFSGIGQAVYEPFISYSSGMRARLGFSVAYHLNPDVLLIDEILGVGDIDFQIKSERLMREKINSDQTVILVTHDPHLIKSVCNRAIWIEEGMIKRAGASTEVADQYLDLMLQQAN